jgi:hypothetical protein
VASAEEKAGTNIAPPVGGEQDDLCMADPQLTFDPQEAEVGGARAEDDGDRCLYIGTRGRATSSPTIATSMSSGRRRTRSGAHLW